MIFITTIHIHYCLGTFTHMCILKKFIYIISLNFYSLITAEIQEMTDGFCFDFVDRFELRDEKIHKY